MVDESRIVDDASSEQTSEGGNRFRSRGAAESTHSSSKIYTFHG